MTGKKFFTRRQEARGGTQDWKAKPFLRRGEEYQQVHIAIKGREKRCEIRGSSQQGYEKERDGSS